MQEKKYQICVIGGGPGGYVAAIRAAQLGFKTVCIDKRATLGGTCLNIGCIPSKALLYSSELYSIYGASGDVVGLPKATGIIDFLKMKQHKDEVVKSLVTSVGALLKKNGIDFIQGEATFSNSNTLLVNGQKIIADNFILATGSEPIALPFAPFDEKKVLSSTGALALDKIPQNMVVVGGGIIGVEIASVFHRLGSKVKIIEMLDHICPGVDGSLAKTLLQSLTKKGIEFSLSDKVEGINVNDKGVALKHKAGEIQADVVLVAVGRRPVIKSLSLESIGVNLDAKGYVIVDNNFKTSLPHIYAIGDVTLGPGLAHRASEEGVAVAQIIAGQPAHVNYLAIPNVIYTHPEVASVGLTEQQAKQLGLELMTGTVYFKGNPRARCTLDTEGFVKVLGDKKSGRLLGVHIIGPHASEMIAVGALAMQLKAKVADLADTPAAHPTLAEALKEAALAALGRAIHG